MVFGLDILQDWSAPKKIYDILIGFVQRNKLRKKLFWENHCPGVEFCKNQEKFRKLISIKVVYIYTEQRKLWVAQEVKPLAV